MRTIAILCVLSCAVMSCSYEGPDTGTSEQGIINGTNCHWEGDTCVCVGSPIVIDTAGDGYSLTGHADGVQFALTPGRAARRWSWTNGRDDAWLTLPGSDGVVSSGAEMFGDNTLQSIGDVYNGFTALSVHDGNGDGRIDASDAVYTQLRLWFDRTPRDGISQPGELVTLESAGIRSLSTDYAESPLVDAYGNEFRYVGDIDANAPVAAVAHDVFLLSVAIAETPTGPVDTNSPTPVGTDIPNTFTCMTECRSKTVNSTIPGYRIILDRCKDTSPWQVERRLGFNNFAILDKRQIWRFGEPTELVGNANGVIACHQAASLPLVSMNTTDPDWGPCEIVPGSADPTCNFVQPTPPPPPTGGGGCR